MYALDTCILINFLRGRLGSFYTLIRNSDPRLFKVPAIVEAELRTGALKSNNPDVEDFKIDELLLPFEIIPFDSSCAHAYAKIRTTLENQGQRIGSNDLAIAAVCVANDLVLITHNVREFKRIPSLRLENWAEMDAAGNFCP